MVQKGLSRRALAHAAHVSLSAVDKWLTGTRPRDWTLKMLSANLRVNYRWLAEGAAEQPFPETLEIAIRSPASLDRYYEEVAAIDQDYAEGKAKLEETLKELRGEYRHKLRLAAERLREANEHRDEKEGLQNTYWRVVVASVGSPDSLIAEVIEALKQHATRLGSQKALAGELGVTPQQLNDWLSGRVKPNWERTLRLRDWIRANEAQQKEGSEGAETPSKPRSKRGKSR
jgi:transcriptional regulator with XRE-family HTH domain